MAPLSIVLLLRQATGSYTVAGVTAALFALGDAVSAPVQGRLVDRFGRARVLVPTVAAHAAAVSAILVLVRNGAPAGALAVCGCVAGVGMPPVSGSIKAVWPQLAGPAQMPAGYAIESMLQQVIFLVGPLLVAALTTVSGPATALACAAVLAVAGTVGFVVAAAAVAPGREMRDPRPAGGAWRAPTVRILVYCTVLQAVTFGVLPVGLAALTAAAGAPHLAGVLLATLTLGGLIGTFWPMVGADRRRYVRLCAWFAAGLLPVAALSVHPSPFALLATAAVLVAAGVFVTPIAATSYVLVQQATAPTQRTEAFTWLSTGQAAGNAAGAAVAGVLVSGVGTAAALLVPPVAGAVSALVGAALNAIGGHHRTSG
jgi:MFS family permease